MRDSASGVAANASGNFALAGNYDASSDGTYSQSPVDSIFSGHFEGLGNVISNLSINDGNAGDYTGLFYEIYPGGSVSDLYVSNVNISSENVSAAGAIAGDNFGTIANSYSSGIVDGGQLATGGIAGYCIGTITNSWSKAAVTGASAGGLVGQKSGRDQRESHATGKVEAVSGPNSPIGGGLVGENQGSVETSWASGSVTGSVDSSLLGGLIGEMDGVTVRNAYATGAVSGVNSFIGGFAGYTDLEMSDSYSTGMSSGTGGFVGGFVGYDGSTGMKHTYWDTTTSGITDPSKGAGNIANDPGIKGLSTSKLQSGLPKGLNEKIWSQNAKINGGLPYLRSNPPTK